MRRVLAETGKASERERERDLPAHVMVYYHTIALALYMTARTRGRCCAACWRGSAGSGARTRSGWRGKSGIPQARTRSGEGPPA